MSIWQNIKEADYTFEKLLFKWLGIVLIGITFFFLVDKAFDLVPDIKKLFRDNSSLFSFFLLSFAVTVFIAAAIYNRTLDFIEAETKQSRIASIINVIIWIVFWLFWSVFCARLTLQTDARTMSVQVALLVLVMLPGLLSFIFTHSIRMTQIKDEEKSKRELGDKYNSSEAYTLYLDKRYYSGYYGLICLPVYLVYLLVGHLL